MTLPLVLVPGLNCTAALFAPQLPALAARRSVMIGCHTRHASMAELAASILRDAPPKFVLGGLSMGGYISFEILRRAPERVAGLILMDTSARPDTPESRERRLRQLAIADGGRFGEIPAMQIPLLLAPANAERLGGTVRAMAATTGADAFARQQRAILARPDSRPDLPGVAVPTLVVVGELDLITPPDAAHEMADTIPGARLIEIPGCGHLSTIEAPDTVTAAIETFFGETGL
jgi:pimeloyl-ACP methyl ester carboxylesterase